MSSGLAAHAKLDGGMERVGPCGGQLAKIVAGDNGGAGQGCNEWFQWTGGRVQLAVAIDEIAVRVGGWMDVSSWSILHKPLVRARTGQ